MASPEDPIPEIQRCRPSLLRMWLMLYTPTTDTPGPFHRAVGSAGQQKTRTCLPINLSQQCLSKKGLAPSCPKVLREPGGTKVQLQEQDGAGSHRCDNGPHQVVPVPVLEGREVAMTSTLLKKILGHCGNPREQFPG